MAISPLTASPNLSGFARPAPVAQPAAGQAAPRPAPEPAIGGGAATSAIANQARQAIIERSRSTVNDGPGGDEGGRPRPQIPDPPFAQSVGLYNNSTRVFVDIVLSGDQGRRVARVFGTPPAPSASSAGGNAPVNFTA